MSDLVTAVALVLVIEGALYALFPDAMRRMMTAALEQPASVLRIAGLAAMAAGVFVVWIVRG